MVYCEKCDRDFRAPADLKNHCQSKHRETYCSRCQRDFPHGRARQQHIDDSSLHHVCDICDDEPDFFERDDYDEHLVSEHHYCDSCDQFFDDSDELSEHDVDVHNMCHICETFHDSVSNLKNHLKTHAAKTVECLCCSRKFISNSAMILHLEAGTCESGADEDRLAEIFYEYHTGRPYKSENEPWPVECYTCGSIFPLWSAFLQHAESDACEHPGYNRNIATLFEFTRLKLLYH